MISHKVRHWKSTQKAPNTHLFPLNYLEMNKSEMEFVRQGHRDSTAPALIPPRDPPGQLIVGSVFASCFLPLLLFFLLAYFALFPFTLSVLPSLSEAEVPDEGRVGTWHRSFGEDGHFPLSLSLLSRDEDGAADQLAANPRPLRAELTPQLSLPPAPRHGLLPRTSVP